MKIYLWLFLIISFCSCHTIKSTTIIQGDKEQAIEIAITDFLNNCNLSKTDSVFSVNINMDNNDILGLSIFARHDYKIAPDLNDKIGMKSSKFPSHYIERHKKLFFWYIKDSEQIITKEIVVLLSKYNQIDSTFVNQEKAYPDYGINENIKGADYYFCKNNLNNFKRVITKTAMSWYPQPKLKCIIYNKRK